MLDKDLTQISISRIIPAEKWRIMRLLTRVEDFPSYVPNIKKVTLLKKARNLLKTKWSVEIEKVPISWVEEEILELRKNCIRFRAIKGDLEKFRGQWQFQDTSNGTRVTITVSFKVGIPAIEDFANTYIKKLVTKNFEAILESMERRLISMKYKTHKHSGAGKIAGFGVIGHFYNFCHLQRALKRLNPDFKLPSRRFLGQLFNITPSFKLHDVDEFKSKSGQTTKGCFIVATFIPDMIEKDMWTIFSKVVRACKVAEKNGVGIVSLGGFASIVGERIGHEIADEVDVSVTTGNTLASVMAIDGVLKAAVMFKMYIPSTKVAIIGGTGDIGSACARVLADKVKQLTITGRTKSNLRRLKVELSKKRHAHIKASINNESAIKDADIVIAAASSTASILKMEWFKPGSIVCDVGYPKNVSYAPKTRDDILVFSGGLASTPTPVRFPVDTGLPRAGVLYGCFAEAIVLSLEKRFENYSFGRGNITPQKIDEMREMSKKHGFDVSDFYWGRKLVTKNHIKKILENSKAANK